MAAMPISRMLFYYLWVAPHVLLLGVTYAIFRRRLAGVFPLFLTYTLLEAVQFAFLFTFSLVRYISVDSYFNLYCVGFALSTILRFGILLEIMGHLFRKYRFLEAMGKPIFRWLTVGLLLVGLGLAVNAREVNPDHTLWLLVVLNRAALILQTGLLVSLFVFSRYFNLSWRNPDFGIALGLGVYATMDLVDAAIRSQTWSIYSNALNYMSMAAYHCSVVVWLFYLWAPEQAAQPNLENVPQHNEVEAWSQELERLLHR
jgi:hypothetical protein